MSERMTLEEIKVAIKNAEKGGPQMLTAIAAQAIFDLGTIADALKQMAEQGKPASLLNHPSQG